jgi:hypothetical protein
VLYLFWYACVNSWLLKLHAIAPKIANTTITNQQEVTEQFVVLKQQQTIVRQLKLRAKLRSKTNPVGSLIGAGKSSVYLLEVYEFFPYYSL